MRERVMSKKVKKSRSKLRKLRYPATSPSMEKDSYFPFTDIPRPIFRDVRLHPDFFKVKKKKTWLEKKQRK